MGHSSVDANWERIYQRWQHMPHGQKGAYIEKVAADLGVSPDTVYRQLRRRFGKQKEVEREAEVPERLVQLVIDVKERYQSMTLKNSSRELSTREARRIAAKKDPDVLNYSVSTYNAAMRRNGYRTPQKRTRREADYVGQHFQIDFSRSKHFQMVGPTPENDGDWIVEVSAKERHYKSGAVKLRTWIVQMLDDHSRVRLARCYPATAESGLLFLRFLRWAWGRPHDAALMQHVPDKIKADQGPALKAKEVRTLLDRLDVGVQLAGVESSKSQGKVERGFGTIWKTIEAAIATEIAEEKGDGARLRLSTLNKLVHARIIDEQEKEHPTRPGKRGELYQRSVRERKEEGHPIRTAPDHVLDLAARTWRRYADETRMVSIDNKKLEVPKFAADKWVRIHRNLEGDFVGELINGYRKGEYFPVEPYDFASVDFETEKEKRIRQEVRNDTRRELAEAADEPTYPEPDGEEAEADSPFDAAETPDQAPSATELSLLQARAAVGKALRRSGVDDEDHQDTLDQLVNEQVLHDGITRQEVDDVIATLT